MSDTITGKYLSVTSYKRDGTAVATPVWFVADDGHLFVETDDGSFKARRIRRNPEVMVAPCSATGRLRGEQIRAHAEFLPEGERQRVEQLIARKYRIDRVLILPIYRAIQRVRGKRLPPEQSRPVILSITPTS